MTSAPFSFRPLALPSASFRFPAVKAADASSQAIVMPARLSLACVSFAASIPLGSFFALPSSSTLAWIDATTCGSEAARSFHAFVSSSFFAAAAATRSFALLPSSVPAARAPL